MFLQQFECEEGEEDPLDEGGDAHDEANEVALLEKQRNLVVTFILFHKNINIREIIILLEMMNI